MNLPSGNGYFSYHICFGWTDERGNENHSYFIHRSRDPIVSQECRPYIDLLNNIKFHINTHKFTITSMTLLAVP